MRVCEYPFKFTSAEKGGWVTTCRDLPEAISQDELHLVRTGSHTDIFDA